MIVKKGEGVYSSKIELNFNVSLESLCEIDNKVLGLIIYLKNIDQSIYNSNDGLFMLDYYCWDYKYYHLQMLNKHIHFENDLGDINNTGGLCLLKTHITCFDDPISENIMNYYFNDKITYNFVTNLNMYGTSYESELVLIELNLIPDNKKCKDLLNNFINNYYEINDKKLIRLKNIKIIENISYVDRTKTDMGSAEEFINEIRRIKNE